MKATINSVKCSVLSCTNRVSQARLAAGHSGCKELHPTAAPERTLIPLPKGNTVVGPKSDLIGAASSHKTGTPDMSPDTFGGYANVKPREAYRSTLAPVPDELCRRLVAAVPQGGGIYLWGDRVLALAHRLGWVTSRTEPARLTAKGLLAREVCKHGRTPEELK